MRTRRCVSNKTVMGRASVLPLYGPQLKKSPNILRSTRMSIIEEKMMLRQKQCTGERVKDRGCNTGTNVCRRLQQ